MPKKKADIKTSMSEKPIAIDPVKAEIIDKPKVKEPTIIQLVEMDNKIWVEIDYIKGKITQLEGMIRQVQGRMGLQ